MLLLAALAPLLVLVCATRIAVAQRPEPKVDSKAGPVLVGDGVLALEPLGDRTPQQVTRIQTATLLVPSVTLPLYDLVQVVWENDWYDFDRSMGLTYPDDVLSTELELQVTPGVTVIWGVYEDTGQKFVGFRPPEPNGEADYDVFMAYTSSVGTVFTDSNDITYYFRVERQEGSNLSTGALGGWLTTGYFQFTATMIFPDPFEFEWATAIPTDVLTYTIEPGPEPHWIRWDVKNAVSFYASVIVRDPRFHSDLVIQDLYLDPPSPMAGRPVKVVAVVRNDGLAMPDTYFYTEWYLYPVGLGPPGDPDDHDYGWCGEPGNCGSGRYQFIFDADPSTPDHPDPDFPDPVLTEQLLPGELFTLTRIYQFPSVGTFDLYAQVDVDVQHSYPAHGPNVEMNDSNNIFGPLQITVIPNDGSGVVYLPLILRNH